MSSAHVEMKDEEELSENVSSDDEEEDGDFPILLILTTGLWCILFSVFSFGFDTDPDNCVVSSKDDFINARFPYIDMESPTDPDTIDVATRFRFFFDAAFMLSCI